MGKMSSNGEVLGEHEEELAPVSASLMLAIVRILVSVGHRDTSHQECRNRGQGIPWQSSLGSRHSMDGVLGTQRTCHPIDRILGDRGNMLPHGQGPGGHTP